MSHRNEATAALKALSVATDACRECPLGAHATQSAFGEGPVGAVLMVVGEQPGDKEDLEGRPFVGPAGKLLDRAVAELGWSREKLYVTNAVKHFKYELRGKRRIHKTPGQREAEACHHWLESEMELVQPRAYVALGATAARALLGRPVAVMKERGRWLEEAATGRRVLVTLHPSALLRGDPLQREAAWEAWLKDLAVASDLMKNAAAKRPAEKRPATKKPVLRPAAIHARRRVRMVME
ncbi:UdgX family uracil-DNA binding protein [Variovorax paradoxus]|nr:UdgX family uracil-DNA binding protein [Variovorax paradoxus]